MKKEASRRAEALSVAWDRLFQWGEAVQKATGITEADIERAIREYRREKAERWT